MPTVYWSLQTKTEKEVKNMNQAVLASKIETVKTISEKAKNSKTILICEYRGLTVAQ
jgi:ribosomal protein L10